MIKKLQSTLKTDNGRNLAIVALVVGVFITVAFDEVFDQAAKLFKPLTDLIKKQGA